MDLCFVLLKLVLRLLQKKGYIFSLSHLADTITASRSLHLSAGMDFRHCLDRRNRPGKNTEPAARMVSMITVELSEGREVQWATWRSVVLPPSASLEHMRSSERWRRLGPLLIPCPVGPHESASGCDTQITSGAHYQSPAHVAAQGRSSTVNTFVVNIRQKKEIQDVGQLCVCVCVCFSGRAEQTDYQYRGINSSLEALPSVHRAI